jgi:hypothetical protein
VCGEDHQIGRDPGTGGWVEAGDGQNGLHDEFLRREGGLQVFFVLFGKLAGSVGIVL